jgi:hypothetical protein
MGTHWLHGPRRAWRAAHIAASGAAAVFTIGAVGILGLLGATPAQAMNNEGQLTAVFVVQPTTTQVNTAVTPAVVVKVENLKGQVDTNYNGPVVLQYAVNRLGAPLPTGNEVNAVCGIATFKDLTFSAVGFGFELEAVIPGQQSGGPSPWPSPSGGGWAPGSSRGLPGPGGWTPGWGGGMSQPSSPFDIVDQLLTCFQEETCQSQTVSSDGTSGSADANTQENGTLAATGGGFPTLSCTSVGGVVSFSSNLAKTITVSFSGSLGKQNWHKSVNVCWGSPTEFITKFGFPALFNPVNGEFEGLLPHCSAYRPAPCVSSVWSGSWGGSVKATIQAPAGDPHITFG